MSNQSVTSKNPEPRLLDRVRDALRVKHYSYRTEQAYLHWIKRYIYFHQKQHPAALGAAEVTAFLTHLARDRSARVGKASPKRTSFGAQRAHRLTAYGHTGHGYKPVVWKKPANLSPLSVQANARSTARSSFSITRSSTSAGPCGLRSPRSQ